MRRIEQILGNVHDDPVWRQRYEAALRTGSVETLTLSPWDAQKRRLRVATDHGTDLGIALAEEGILRDGAVVASDGDGGPLIVVRVPGQRLLVLTIDAGAGDQLAERGVRLGHVLGNQHWPARVVGRRVEVSLQIDERVVRSVLKTYQLEGVRYEFVDAPTLPEPNLAVDPSHHHHHHG